MTCSLSSPLSRKCPDRTHDHIETSCLFPLKEESLALDEMLYYGALGQGSQLAISQAAE
jgi:hypothetical protein